MPCSHRRFSRACASCASARRCCAACSSLRWSDSAGLDSTASSCPRVTGWPRLHRHLLGHARHARHHVGRAVVVQADLAGQDHLRAQLRRPRRLHADGRVGDGFGGHGDGLGVRRLGGFGLRRLRVLSVRGRLLGLAFGMGRLARAHTPPQCRAGQRAQRDDQCDRAPLLSRKCHVGKKKKTRRTTGQGCDRCPPPPGARATAPPGTARAPGTACAGRPAHRGN